MQLLLANPAGLWALLAVPAILVVHFLQERSRRVRVSTLFLLERIKPESVGGARFERLRNSVPLWLQILAALFITWTLTEPRWIRQDSRQTVAVVLDSTVSMRAFKEETRKTLVDRLRRWERAAAHTEWHLLESDARKPTLYAGEEISGLLRAFDTWDPTQSSHRPDDALLVARGLVKSNGVVIFVTDRPTELPADVAVLSAAAPLENTGFAGVEVKLIETKTPGAATGMKWTALVRNYGSSTAQREWWVEYPGQPSGQATPPVKSPLELPAGHTTTLSGEFPPEVEQAVLVLGADKFTWDDRLPLQRPKPRVVRAEVHVGGALGDLWRKMLEAAGQVDLAASGTSGGATRAPDLVVSGLGTALEGDGIQFSTERSEDATIEASWTVAEDHALVRDLNWMGLLTSRPMEMAVTETDEPLLWKGDRVLALVRRGINASNQVTRRLILAWELERSNAARHPAMLVMVHRFVESIREEIKESWAGNFESGQPLRVAADTQPAAPQTMLTRSTAAAARYDGRLPEMVDFFQIKQGDKVLVSGATHFADTREADFLPAAPLDTVDQRRWEAALKQTEADPFIPLWVLLTLACLVGAWGWRQGRRATRSKPNAPKYSRTAPA